MMMGYGFMGMFWVWFFLLLLLVGGGVAVVVLLTRQQGRSAPQGAETTPRQILDRRLARGEIDTQEYEALRSRVEA